MYCFAKHPKESKYIITELYKNQGAIDDHLATDVMKACQKEFGPLLVKPLTPKMLQTVGSSGAKPTHTSKAKL